MLRKIFIILFIFIIAFASVNYANTTITLDQIASTFNNCSGVKEYADNNYILSSTADTNAINVSVVYNETTNNLKYTLEENILSASFSEDNILVGILISNMLIDSIGQLHGYSDGELLPTLNTDEILNYTVENEGVEFKVSDKSFEVKIDITKKIPLVDMSNVYIKVEHLEDLKEFIVGDGSAQISKGNVLLWKGGFGNKATVLIGEKGTLTDNTYKSILSLLEVMFESDKTVDYFKENYSNISVGNKEFSGFKIENNPTKDDMEKTLFGDKYEFVRITIDKDLVKASMNGNSTTKTENLNNVENLDRLPETGKEVNSLLIGLYIVVGICFIGVVSLMYTSKRGKKTTK